MSSLVLSIAHRASIGSRIVAPKVKALNLGRATKDWTRQVATALRTTEGKDLERGQHDAGSKDSFSATPSTEGKTTKAAATTKSEDTKSSRPALSTFFHDVDELFFHNKNPFFTPFSTTTETSPLFNDYRNMMSHFWKQMDWMDDMRRKRYLDDFFSNNTGIGVKSGNDGKYFFFPSYDIHSDDEKVQIILDLPGVKLNDININVVDDQWLQISGFRKKKSTTKIVDSIDSSSSSSEAITGGRGTTPSTVASEYKFEKRFNFGDNVIDPTKKIVASLADGVLRVSLPKLSTAVTENMKKVDIVDGSEELEC